MNEIEELKRDFCELLEDYEAKRRGIVSKNVQWYMQVEELQKLAQAFFEEVCRLFKPKPCPLCNDTGEVVDREARQMGYTFGHNEPLDKLEERIIACPLCEAKPDKSKLLTDEKIADALDEYAEVLETKFNPLVLYVIGALLEAQRDLTASIMDAKYQQRVERIKGIENPYDNGIARERARGNELLATIYENRDTYRTWNEAIQAAIKELEAL